MWWWIYEKNISVHLLSTDKRFSFSYRAIKWICLSVFCNTKGVERTYYSQTLVFPCLVLHYIFHVIDEMTIRFFDVPNKMLGWKQAGWRFISATTGISIRKLGIRVRASLGISIIQISTSCRWNMLRYEILS